MKLKKYVGFTVIILGAVACIILLFPSHEKKIVSKLAKGKPDPTATLVDRTITFDSNRYKLQYYSDAEDVSGFKIAGSAAELARAGKTDTSYIISLAPGTIKADCADGRLIVAFKVTFASGEYNVCTTSKSPALVMRFKDDFGYWHKMIFFTPSLHSLDFNDPTFKTIISSISVESVR